MLCRIVNSIRTYIKVFIPLRRNFYDKLNFVVMKKEFDIIISSEKTNKTESYFNGSFCTSICLRSCKKPALLFLKLVCVKTGTDFIPNMISLFDVHFV